MSIVNILYVLGLKIFATVAANDIHGLINRSVLLIFLKTFER